MPLLRTALFSIVLLSADTGRKEPDRSFFSSTDPIVCTGGFGSDNPVGKTITYSNGQEYVVKGVIGFPVNKTWLNFDMLLANSSSNSWEKMPLDLYRFVPGADMNKLNQVGKHPRRLNPHYPSDTRVYTFRFVPLKECYFSKLEIRDKASIYVWGDWGQLQIFMGICALLLVTGLLNFINLYMILCSNARTNTVYAGCLEQEEELSLHRFCRELSAFRFGGAACVGMH